MCAENVSIESSIDDKDENDDDDDEFIINMCLKSVH